MPFQAGLDCLYITLNYYTPIIKLNQVFSVAVLIYIALPAAIIRQDNRRE